jgi:enamine deaminase RidA (YjgF/YER057c/UK114 family)
MEIERINPTYPNWHAGAVVFGDLIFLSGCVADDKSLPIKGQAEDVFAKIDRTLASVGSDKSRLLSATIHLSDLTQKEAMNEAYKVWLDRESLPVRTCVGAVLSPKVLIEVTVCAVKAK